MNKKLIACAVAAGMCVQGCSSKPREFTPSLSAPTADQAKFDADYAECRQLLVEGKLDGDGRLASLGAGAAAGTATMVGGAAAATSLGLAGGAALASATVVAIPFVASAGAVGMAKAKRGKKEKAIQRAMAGCLNERGHQIVGWSRTNKG